MSTEATPTTTHLQLSYNPVINCTLAGGDLAFHDTQTEQYTRIARNRYSLVNGKFDWILQRNQV